jgi:molybdopterin-containing oxidoreductase family iron-sulfur binding subunit
MRPLDLPPDELSRREFVRLLGASAALAGLTGCVRRPSGKILQYVRGTGAVLPGTSEQYATAMTLDGIATGLLVESRDGRPIKIEGNPGHPGSLGAAGAFEQASLLQLYDPDRTAACRFANRVTDWDCIATRFGAEALARNCGARGERLALLLEPSSSPLVARLLDRLQERFPAATLCYSSGPSDSEMLSAHQALFGRPIVRQLDLTLPRTIVAFDADILGSGPAWLSQARQFGDRTHRTAPPRLFVAEAAPSPTGTAAEHRLALSPAQLALLAHTMLQRLAPALGGSDALPPLPDDAQRWVGAVVAAAGGGGVLCCAGARAPAAVHAVVAILNEQSFAATGAVRYTASPIIGAGAPSHDFPAFTAQLAAGAFDTVLVSAWNPCYAAAGDLGFTSALRRARQSLYLGEYYDETAEVASAFAPAAHYLESWGDSRACDGTISPVQPLIAPMHDGRTVAELLAMVVGEPLRGRELVAAHSPDSISDDALRSGVVSGSALPAIPLRVNPAAAQQLIELAVARGAANGLDLQLVPSRAVHDGRFAGNAWLQELPDPITKLTWDNAAWCAPADAMRLNLRTGDIVHLERSGRAIDVPVVVVPGHAAGVITLALGYGRRGTGILAQPIGVDAAALRITSAPLTSAAVVLTPTGRSRQLAITQSHWTVEGRSEKIFPSTNTTPPALYEPPKPGADGFAADQWAMAIDLTLCTGCSACVVACQAENNVPVVGRSGVLQSREMHWLRIDRYLDGPPDAPSFTSQPMLCQHCEKAPCEYACPVDATVHSEDGLNEMVYNRCVGTRFCSNNCPYKVRRFNWFEYNKTVNELQLMARNPEVTVRARGVMEKCSFCVQRIRAAQREAELAGLERTGPVVTACQQSCPTTAITFGSLTDPASAVNEKFRDPRAFSSLGELGTRPRVRYLRCEESE